MAAVDPVRQFSAVDPELVSGPPTTALDELRTELASEVATPPETLVVPGRAGYTVRYSTELAHEQLQAWRKTSRDKSSPDGLDELRWASIVLANQCECVVRHGVDVELDGRPATFQHEGFRALLGEGAERATAAVRRFYGRDADVIAAALAVIRAAGYGDEADADPTTL
jgi:hypothetical protein